MANPGQIEYIANLLERHDLTRDELAEQGEDHWRHFEWLDSATASEIIDWLKDYPRSAG